jgi:hypothetical protein
MIPNNSIDNTKNTVTFGNVFVRVKKRSPVAENILDEINKFGFLNNTETKDSVYFELECLPEDDNQIAQKFRGKGITALIRNTVRGINNTRKTIFKNKD